MRKLVIALITVLCFVYCAFPVLASDVEASKEVPWKQAYRELIVSDAASMSPEMKERTSYHLMNVSDNSAPMMYISYGDYASGGRICYYNEEGLHSEQTLDLYIAYVEGSDMMCWFWGHMGYYYEAVEQWDGNELTELGYGEYGADNGVLVDEDNGETAINSYFWENEEVSREDYRALRLELWDKMVESGGEVIYTGNVPEYDYDGILDLLAVASAPEDPETAFQPVIDEFTEVITLGPDALGQVDTYTYISDLGFGGYIPDSETAYAFHDINNDRIPEMIVGTGADSGRRNTLGVFYLYMRLADVFHVAVDDLLELHDEQELDLGDRVTYRSRTENLENCVAVYRREKNLSLEQLGQLLGGKTKECARLGCASAEPKKKHIRILAAHEGITPEAFCRLYAPSPQNER